MVGGNCAQGISSQGLQPPHYGRFLDKFVISVVCLEHICGMEMWRGFWPLTAIAKY